MGGYSGHQQTTLTLAPWATGWQGSAFAATTKFSIMPFSAAFRNLSIKMVAPQPTGTAYFGSFALSDGSSNLYPTSPVFTVIPTDAAADAFGSIPGVLPFDVPALFSAAAQVTSINSGYPGVIGGYSWDIVGSLSQPLVHLFDTDTIDAGPRTRWVGPGGLNYYTGGEPTEGVIIPYDGTLRNLYLLTNGAQPADGTLAVTLRKTHAGVTTSTALTFTIAANAPAGIYGNGVDTVAVLAGDWITWQFVNGSASVSAKMFSVAMELVPSGSATGMIIFPLYDGVSLNTGYQYATPFCSTVDGTETNVRTPMPRACTMKNMNCLFTRGPTVSPVILTVMKNGAATDLSITIPAGEGAVATQILSDLSHSVSFNALDTFDLQIYQASGQVPILSSISVEID
jgi:hypothetical protein